MSNHEVQTRLMDKENPLTPTVNKEWDLFIQEILAQCWSIDPKQRPTAKELHQTFMAYVREGVALPLSRFANLSDKPDISEDCCKFQRRLSHDNLTLSVMHLRAGRFDM